MPPPAFQFHHWSCPGEVNRICLRPHLQKRRGGANPEQFQDSSLATACTPDRACISQPHRRILQLRREPLVNSFRQAAFCLTSGPATSELGAHDHFTDFENSDNSIPTPRYCTNTWITKSAAQSWRPTASTLRMTSPLPSLQP